MEFNHPGDSRMVQRFFKGDKNTILRPQVGWFDPGSAQIPVWRFRSPKTGQTMIFLSNVRGD